VSPPSISVVIALNALTHNPTGVMSIIDVQPTKVAMSAYSRRSASWQEIDRNDVGDVVDCGKVER
jgi:hypothetical protein